MRNKPQVKVQRMPSGVFRWAVIGFHGDVIANSRPNETERTRKAAREAGTKARDQMRVL